MEQITNFQFIWMNWVEPIVNDLYEQMDDNFKDKCRVSIRDLSQIKRNAERYYQKRRDELKKEFYGEYHKGDSAIQHRMDFHKIGALLCGVMMEYKVIDFDIKECEQYAKDNIDQCDTDWVVKNALVNFRIAFYVSIVFLFQSMLFLYDKTRPKICEELRKNKRLDLYEKNKDIGIDTDKNRVHESFENCVVLDLAKQDINSRSFDYFMYSTILYQLEEHNLEILA